MIFTEGQPADTLYILLEGSIDLSFTTMNESRPESSRELAVGDINPGEVFGISAIIEPHVLTAVARASKPSRILKINAAGLQSLCNKDKALAYELMRQVAIIAMERLKTTRVQLAAAWA